MRLPPTVKHLLTLRGPNPPPPPTIVQLNALLSSTLSDAKNRNAETGWLVATTCALLTANSPTSVGQLYRFATRSDPNEVQSRYSISRAVTAAALMRESAFKSTIFVGVPRVILSMAGLMEALEDDVKADLRTSSLRTADRETIEPIKLRGRALWDSIYQPHADKLYNKLAARHPDFMPFIIQAYGSALAPLPGNPQGNLSRTLGSVVGTACLRAEGGVGPQLTSHVFGLLKARSEAHLSEEDKWLTSDEGTEWVIRTVDSVIDVVKSNEVQAKL